MPVNGERPDFDVIDVRGVGLNPFSVAKHGQKHPAEGEDTDENGPKHELIIENSKHRVFCYHATTLFDRPHSPSLSVCWRGLESWCVSLFNPVGKPVFVLDLN